MNMQIKSIKRPWEKDRDEHRHNNRSFDRQFYQSKEWRRVRNAFIAANPKCVQCGGPSNIADHIVRIKDGGDPLNWSNLQAMCSRCHNKKDNNAWRSDKRGNGIK
jgi:5-methylcytosine-specific restriction protein A